LPTPNFAEKFGYSISLGNGRIAVGAPDRMFNGIPFGGVSVYEGNGSSWIETATLNNVNASIAGQYGYDVDLDGDRLIIGEPQLYHSQSDGQAWIYHYNNSTMLWDTETFLQSSTVTNKSRFGFSVAIEGDTAIVGSPEETKPGSVNKGGGAFVFTYSTSWTEQSHLTNSNRTENDHFGYSVDIAGNEIVVGTDQLETPQGTAYRFEWNGNTWIETNILVPTGIGGPGSAGKSVAIDVETIILGAPVWKIGCPSNCFQTGGAFFYGECLNDWNKDSLFNTADFTAYLNDYNAVLNQQPWVFQDPDIEEPRGVVNSADLVRFLNLYNLGC